MGKKQIEIQLNENTLGRSIRITSGESEYDGAVKRLLAEKSILAWILKKCVAEFMNCSIDDIMNHYIEGKPEIGITPVLPDEVLPTIHGIGTEDASLREGIVRYDIRFIAKAPKSGELITLIINIEAQKDYYPGYKIVKRAIYNCSRMISSQ